MAITTIGMIMGLDGLTVLAVVLVGIRVTERMSPQGMGITLTPTNATPQGTAGIHAPIIIMGIKARCGAGRLLALAPPLRNRRNSPSPTGQGAARVYRLSANGYRC